MAAGRDHGIINFGMRALLSLRLEKNFPTWYPDLDKSRALLKEAGAEGLKIGIQAAPAYAPDIPTAQVLQSQLKRVGIDLQIQQMVVTTSGNHRQQPAVRTSMSGAASP